MARADEISQLVQPYLRDAVRKGLEETAVVRAAELLHPLRFDLCAKHIYARWREEKICTDWGKNLYCEHLLALNCGREIYPPKVGVEEFVHGYDSLLDSIGGEGEGRLARFDAARSVVPIDENGVLMDGAHRTAACLFFGIPLTIARINRAASSLPRSFDFSFDFFKTRGLPSNYLDFMSLEYARLSEDSYLAVIFPAASQIEQMKNALRENCEIVCGKTIKVRGRFAAANIIRQIYPCESWIGNLSNGFEGAYEDAVYRFADGDELKILLLRADSPDDVKNAKEKARTIAGVDNYSIDITGNHAETLCLAKLFFNRNSVYAICSANSPPSEEFERRLKKYADAIGGNENFCIHGSAVMEAHGIRRAKDLDYISRNEKDLQLDGDEISLGNDKPGYASMTPDDIICDPANHFYYCGIKFASLSALCKMKEGRAEPKDFRDLALIKDWRTGKIHRRTISNMRWRMGDIFPKYKRKIFRRKIRCKLREWLRLPPR